jgi:LysR family glycine cleavage system transcriptional activator
MQFPLSSEDCELLLLLDMTGSLAGAAHQLRRDISVISRQVGKMAEKAPVVEKIDGRWQVSQLGRAFANWTRDSIQTQNRLLKGQTKLRIATTREFAARVFAPQISHFLGRSEDLQIEVISSQQGVESLILKGEADLALDCGRPRDPQVKFQRVTPESFSIVAASSFVKKFKVRGFAELLESPYLQFTRLSAVKLLHLDTDLLKPVALFNDIAAVRAAAVAGAGWSLLPTYAVKLELNSGELVSLEGKTYPSIESESFGVWWLRERRGLEPWVTKMTSWLKTQRL